jgi:membrane fusion protein (multidrug efflux system)
MEESTAAVPNGARKKIAIIIFILAGITGALALYFYLSYKATHISTDDAFVDGDIHTIASKVPGTIKNILVASNQYVKKGDILVELDTADYDVKVRETTAAFSAEKNKIAEADAKIEVAKKQMAELQARADSVKAVLELQKANLEQAEKDMARAEALIKKEAISKERYEKTTTAYKVALAQVKAATEGLKNSLLSVEAQKSVGKQAEASRTTQASTAQQKEAQMSDSELKYGYTKIFAPADGYITRKAVEVGNQVQAGQPLMAVVPLDNVHITANYKETDLKKIKPGQKVEIEVDTYTNKTFHGKVDSIMAGTGAVFSLFPPENATGNFVKVVQRVPVKIVLDKDADPRHILRIGMSVQPTVVVK